MLSSRNKIVRVGRTRVAAAIATLITASLLASCGGTDGASADGSGGADCLAGKTVDFGVPYEAGGGYDQYARLMAPHLESELDTTLVVRNEPGAGGLVSLNRTDSTTPEKPRLEILELLSAAGGQIGGGAGVQYDLKTWSWVGRLVAEPEVVLVANDSPLQTWEDVVNSGEDLKFGTSGPGGSSYVIAHVLKDAFDAPLDVTSGFEGSTDLLPALLRGDIELMEITLSTAMPNIESGEVRPIVAVADEAPADIADVPVLADLSDLAVDDSKVQLMEGLTALMEVGRSVAATPGLDEACLESIRTAFDNTVKNPEFLADAEKVERPVDPITGAELSDLLDTVFEGADTSGMVEILKATYATG